MNADKLAPGPVLLITNGRIRSFKEQKSSLNTGKIWRSWRLCWANIIHYAHLCEAWQELTCLGQKASPPCTSGQKSHSINIGKWEMIYSWGTDQGPITWPSTPWPFDVFLWAAPIWKTCSLAVCRQYFKLTYNRTGQRQGLTDSTAKDPVNFSSLEPHSRRQPQEE